MGSKVAILGFILVFSVRISTSRAQENKVIAPPDWEPITRTFMSLELQIDSAFIERLDSMLFDKKWERMNSILSSPNSSKSWRHFYISFEKKAGSDNFITVSLGDTPARNSIGFLKRNEYFYWFYGDVPPNIILKTKSKKRFSYKEYMYEVIDPPFGFLIYNSQTGNIEVNEKDCY